MTCASPPFFPNYINLGVDVVAPFLEYDSAMDRDLSLTGVLHR